MRKYIGVSIGVALLCLLSIASAAAQGEVIPFTVIEIECSEVAGEEVETDGVIHSTDQVDTAVWFSAEPILNGSLRNVLSWDYYMEPDVGLYGGETIFTPDGVAGVFKNSFSGYWDAEGGSFSARGFGSGELAGMQISVSGGGDMDLDSALAIAKGDPRIVNGNPCYPGPMPTHGEAAFLYGQLVDNRAHDATSNKTLMLQIIEAWNVGDWDTFRALASPDFVSHFMDGTEPEGLEEFISGSQALLADTPGMTCTLSDMIAEGDRVAAPATCTADDFQMSGILIYRFEDGKLVERWGAFPQ